MPYRVTLDRRPSFLHARMEGEESLEDALRFWETLAELSTREGISDFLVIDTVVGSLNIFQHFQISVEIAKWFRGKRIAYVDPKEATYAANEFGENVLQNRGVTAKVFRSEAAAVRWLVGDLVAEEQTSR
jgi:hypothetical protein